MAMEDKVVDGMVVPTPKTGEGGEVTTPNSVDAQVWDDLEEALESLHDALPEYDKAEAYYEGTVKEKFLNKAVQQLLTGSDTDFNVNLAGRVVDAVQDRMEIAAVTAEPVGDDEEEDEDNNETGSDLVNVTPGASGMMPVGVGHPEVAEAEEMSEEEKALDEAVSRIWRDNEMDIEAPEIHQKMLEYGDAYLFVGLNDDEKDRVDLFFNSPKNVRILYDDENPRKKKLAIKRWEVGPKNNKRIRLNLYYPEGTHKFISKGASDRAGASDFQVYVDDSTDENGYLENETGEIPFFHFRTARPYGTPEHKKAYGAQDALTKIITNMMATSDFAAFPQRWALQESGTTTDDDLDWDEDGADEKKPADLQSQLISGPGRIWPLRNMKAVGQFQAADMEQFLKPLNTFTGLMAAVTATPVSYFLVSVGATATPVSGESQRKGESPFISKVNNRQLSAEASWQDAVGYGLRLIGMDAEVKVRWAPLQIVSGKEGWEAVQAQQKAGVPVRQTLLEAGYTEAEVTSWGYTEDNPDGSGSSGGMDMSGVPLPGNAFPGSTLPEVAPTPPATEPATVPAAE
ncbi:portal protein [Streptomyces phage Zuko]|uniref:Portal protein n=1 Tax=Streptomyces phage Zuko TaxID=2601695 RepID=A0A5J6D7N0_9CAUD|nr:portal protein [Streptomyces phage Zuko]QEQ93586.1 portal protein [Streptomyces phage Zuko]